MTVIESDRDRSRFDDVETAIDAIENGEMVLLVDEQSREDEGDLYVPAEAVTPEHVNFMLKHGRGLVCAPVAPEITEDLGLEQMVPASENTEEMSTRFTVSVDAASTGTGISAYDRAETIQALVDPATEPGDLDKPGHIFPLEARADGVLDREGHTEAAVDLARIAGYRPGGVICEVVDDDGTMAREDRLMEFADEHDLPIVTVADVLEYRHLTETLVSREVDTRLPTEFGTFDMYGYDYRGETHVALVNFEDVDPATDRPLVRIHSKCLTGDALHSLKCDCGFQLEETMQRISEEGGVLLYLDQEGRGIGLLNKLKAYELQEQGFDTVEANVELGFEPDERRFDAAAQMLRDIGLDRVRLLTNNPRKAAALERFDFDVEIDSLQIEPNPENEAYLETKAEKLDHQLDVFTSD
ncbi:GTP cyclohydrolase II protein [Halorhabdus tiamatea SARL4B]|uniref:Multifunctional fusion protein n=1 Tax=Halorhabdus tiamatea SARL4B TaxID=1033806 RepID=F7PNI9_9EURY|nr:bifunctional 3,4-dihydroxy-2-butanone-4-phosphate synthase/GTP cyclohydrolase II [Halorhabdus tiamatea]ERJ06212.1 GTP cyclohydrolase II protein [Halorhabdus tiamatea SARL4B]CCQ33772.1 GTP cyclohydrolase II [Halorhabdus tiamatea SARL4B]